MGKNLAIIGGGASGAVAAILASREGLKVSVFDGNSALLKKLHATGNGRCNLGNDYFEKDCYYGDVERAFNIFHRFSPEDTFRFFNSLGLFIKDIRGYLYPLSESAKTVVETLEAEIRSLGINVITNSKVVRVDRLNKGFKLTDSEGKTYEFDACILCTGGNAAPKTGSDGVGIKLALSMGHSIVKTVPGLVPLKSDDEKLKTLAGVRAEGCISLYDENNSLVCRESGEMQFTDSSVSGIPVFQISRVANYLMLDGNKVYLKADFFPGADEAFRESFLLRKLMLHDRNAKEFFTGILNDRLMEVILKEAGVDPLKPCEDIKNDELERVYDLCRNLKFTVKGNVGYDKAQVTAGGIPLSELDHNLQSLKCEGLFMAGEIINVDGKCGGYNLQWAFSSGAVAAEGALNYLKQGR
ncbi:MAG: aminoacetone oxidase family FAD-binding enzyme [Acetatifactor sp.]|nr:aminoacetone oxidase family FAD-binding enzyme [Acetatifactor sp.]